MTDKDTTGTVGLQPTVTAAEGAADTTLAADTKTAEDVDGADALEDFDLEDVEIIESKVFA